MICEYTYSGRDLLKAGCSGNDSESGLHVGRCRRDIRLLGKAIVLGLGIDDESCKMKAVYKTGTNR